MLKDILERAGSIGYTINIPACVENVLVDLGGPQVSGPVSRGNLQKRENFMKSTIEKKNLKYFLQKFYILDFFQLSTSLTPSFAEGPKCNTRVILSIVNPRVAS